MNASDTMGSPESEGPRNGPTADELSSSRTAVFVAYLMYGGMFIGMALLPVVGAVINYLKLNDNDGQRLPHLYASHHRWMLRTFWWTLGWAAGLGLVAATVVLLPLAFVGYGVLALWYLYRIVRGALRFIDQRSMDW